MSLQKELEIKMQFLEEATEHLNTLENVIVEAKTHRKIDLQKINAALRAAHSIKGGAGIMGFRSLSDLSHLLEDSFKVLKSHKNSLEIDNSLQNLLLSAIDWLRQIVESISVGHDVDEQWINTFCYPVFAELRDILGEPIPEDAMTILSPESNPQEIISLLFKTEVEDYLQRLESLLKQKQSSILREEMVMMSSQLGGLGEMLQIPAFVQLCESIIQHLSTAVSDAEVAEIAQLGLQSWRNTQSLLIAGQLDNLPTTIKQNQAEDYYRFIVSPELNLVNNTPSLEENVESFPEFTHITKRENQEPTVRVPSRELEQINDLFGELTIGRNTVRLQLERVNKLIRNLNIRVKNLERENQELRLSYDKFSLQLSTLKPTYSQLEKDWQWEDTHKFDPLQLERYSELHILSQTVTENIVKIQEITGDITVNLEDTDQVNRLLNKTSRKLQNSLTKVRMRPLSDIMERLPRALHNLSQEYGKKVNLQIAGADILIERGILEALNEPLMHLLRNAFDHGIEDTQTRIAAGKPEQGLIEINTVHHGDRTIITIHDDGRGIQREKIRSRAESMGLDTEMLANASDEDLLSLIFEPGFSTSEQVTTLSGRGVGMDIVCNNLKLIDGKVTVDSVPGKGTTFTLSLPFTLSVARIVLIESNGIPLAFPTDTIQEICLLEDKQILPAPNGKVINWRNTLVELINISQYLELNHKLNSKLNGNLNNIHSTSSIVENPPRLAEKIALIININHQLIAIQADRCWDEQEVSLRRVEGNIPLPEFFNNCTILNNGRIAPLINPAKLLDLIAKTDTVNPISQPDFSTPFLLTKNQKNSILIVDDSINVRRFLALTLEKAGYFVEQAKDGQDALFQLQSGLQVQGIICDIEMPRLDGYNFLIRLKSYSHLQHIPVMMLSSRNSEKYRQLAIQLGAKVYLSKPYNEHELLQTLKQVLKSSSLNE
ncbi:MAG: hybrid sensor histidine kinase/response regulator [Richelia sp. RM2_1_2]|nr:hybrid sensor histidine kinase/response regulator [Richelia sp. SM1_7_0]NJN07295.1 hybrid sensor histidine kinase/response regulator [Richelia sp. RM1_1_1]NJO30657.1 hybrid sensor histidine kinase/response regulator [Richelia sp. SL_2_1]NJO60444.1 hybrid sensor histidine kinase/response regulator [Richelia sp. RM2_1_2]